MMKLWPIAVLLLLGVGCGRQSRVRSFSTLDVTYNDGGSITLSIRISNCGEVVAQKGNRIRPVFFRGRLSNHELDKLERLYTAMSIERYDSVYSDPGGEDFASFKIVIPERKPAGIFVYGHRGGRCRFGK
ncbi:hypothetical protein HGH92_30810 [Chitinophaga varians]|uniref:Lipoprotein n=1 Tax=Chitinophaga varians TaxID=2202339 RepID=A0A847S2T9_9BACT|nr:hypothetical protein [Chitinophaga varians]NLR68734.1 hypothetical protein [Chitinophaga varians]